MQLITKLLLIILNFQLSVQQCPNSWISLGSFCYYITTSASGTTMQEATTACALQNSSLPIFKNSTDYNLFKQYWNSNNPVGSSFYINLYSYDATSWTWKDTGSKLNFHDFTSSQSLSNFTYPCVYYSFDGLTGGWSGSDCNVRRTSIVCHTLKSDIPQECYPIHRSCQNGKFRHKFTLDYAYSTYDSNFIQEGTTFGGLYAWYYNIDGYTAPVYEMLSPPPTQIIIYAHSNSNVSYLLQYNYTLNGIAFYLPTFYLTQKETTVTLAWKNTTPDDSVFMLVPEYQSASTYLNFYTAQTVLVHQNDSAYCSNLMYDCNYTVWTTWSACSVSCGDGVQTRARTLVYPAIGMSCSNSSTSDVQACNAISNYTNWTEWSTCSVSCGDGVQTRARTIIYYAAGWPCSNSFISDYQACNNGSCLSEDIYLASGINIASADPISLPTTIEESIPYMYSSLSVPEKMSLGYSLKDKIKTCTYNEKFCNMERDFKTIYDPGLGNCFTFNYPETSLYYSERAGEIYGVKMLLNSSQSDYLCSTIRSGFCVLIHNSSINPFVDNVGYELTPGYVHSISITQINTALLGSPYGTCVSHGGSYDYYYPGVYTVEGCLRSCFQNKVLSNCGCGDPRFGLPSDKGYCNIFSKPCVEQTYQCALSSTFKCNCPPPCEDVMYPLSITKARLFNDPFILGYCSMRNETFSDCLSFTKINFAILKVAFQSLQSLSFEEQASYDVCALLSDFSNVTGLLLGACVMTVPEIFVFFCILLYSCCFGKALE